MGAYKSTINICFFSEMNYKERKTYLGTKKKNLDAILATPKKSLKINHSIE